MACYDSRYDMSCYDVICYRCNAMTCHVMSLWNVMPLCHGMILCLVMILCHVVTPPTWLLASSKAPHKQLPTKAYCKSTPAAGSVMKPHRYRLIIVALHGIHCYHKSTEFNI